MSQDNAAMTKAAPRLRRYAHFAMALASSAAFIALCFHHEVHELIPLVMFASSVAFLFVAALEARSLKFHAIRESAGPDAETTLRSGLVWVAVFLLSGFEFIFLADTTNWNSDSVAWPTVRVFVPLTVWVTGSVAAWKLFHVPAYYVAHNHSHRH